MDVFAIGLGLTILFATSLGFWLALRRGETTDIKLTELKPPRSKKYFSLLKMSLVCLLAKATNLKTLDRFAIELWNNGRYEEASWLKEEIQRIKMLMLKK